MRKQWQCRSWRLAQCVVAMIALLHSAGAASAPENRTEENRTGKRIRLSDCRLESASESGSVAARCGWLEVPENRAAAASRKLRLHVAVIPALRLQPAPDPLFVLAGGPGQAASDFYLVMNAAFSRIRRDRDIVLLDQRGTGRSNRLDCAFDDDTDFARANPQQLQKQARACIASLPGDPRFYTTSVAVRDLDEVRAALGYASLNFYAVSYGTRVAQHFLRRYPDRVRSVILDGVVPVDLALGPDIAPQAQRALDALFDRCAADTACRWRFPTLRSDFAALRASLQATPLTLQVPDPLTARATDATFGIAELGAAVRLLSYSDETASVLPLLIDQAHHQRPQGMLAQSLMIHRNLQAQIAYGMHFAVTCSEDAPRWPPMQMTSTAIRDSYLGDTLMTGMQAICSGWPRGPVDDDFNAPLHSAVPALLLSGGNDPVTPAEYAARAKSAFSNSRHLVLPGQGHGQLAVGCMPRLAALFIERQTRKMALTDSDLKCLANVAPAPFMLSTTATSP